MKGRTSLAAAVFVTGLALLVVAEQAFQRAAAQGQAAGMVEAPKFEVDPTFPKPLPNGWLMGNVIGIAVDAQDHIWVVHRQDTSSPGAAVLAGVGVFGILGIFRGHETVGESWLRRTNNRPMSLRRTNHPSFGQHSLLILEGLHLGRFFLLG